MEDMKKNHLPFVYILVFLIFFALPFKMSVLNIMVTLTAICGIYYFFRAPSICLNALKQNHFLMLFMLIWIPILISAIDSIDPQTTLKIAGNILRFLFIGVLCFTLSERKIIKITDGIVYLLLFFCVDAVVQWLTGYNILGARQELTRITGVFGSKFHLGYVVATLSPILLMFVMRRFMRVTFLNRVFLVVMVVLLILTVLISGARSGWVSLTVSLFLLMIWLLKKSVIKKRGVIYLVIATLITGGVISQLPIIKNRYLQSMTVYVGDYTWFDRVTSYRTTMWKVALKEVQKHPINGIGAGGFPRAFDAVTLEEKGYFSAALLVHLHGLEVLTETGVIGFLCYLYLCFYLLRAIYRAKTSPEWLMVAFLALMPINTHMSLYSSFWSPFIWVALALGLAQQRIYKD